MYLFKKSQVDHHTRACPTMNIIQVDINTQIKSSSLFASTKDPISVFLINTILKPYEESIEMSTNY